MINNRRRNFRINQRREIYFRPRTTPPRTLNRIEEIPERINNMQNLVIYSREGRELGNAIIEPDSSSNIEFVIQSTTEKEYAKTVQKKKYRVEKAEKFLVQIKKYTTNPQRSLEATEPQQISVRYNTTPINRRTDRDHLQQRQRREHR
ncbi:26093_t:CDS:2 [Gigaspora margarita]|uniref:26093_t:CDS:1 n=1 Tax=Gigaspora margarita TaxID=4874 RepID=A0ABN7UYI7_GIGMA|nr:26093_t:CDS:2 [Gigaspora margarita]